MVILVLFGDRVAEQRLYIRVRPCVNLRRYLLTMWLCNCAGVYKPSMTRLCRCARAYPEAQAMLRDLLF